MTELQLNELTKKATFKRLLSKLNCTLADVSKIELGLAEYKKMLEDKEAEKQLQEEKKQEKLAKVISSLEAEGLSLKEIEGLLKVKKKTSGKKNSSKEVSSKEENTEVKLKAV